MECYSSPGLVGKSIEASQKFNLKCHINIAIQNLLSFLLLYKMQYFCWMILQNYPSHEDCLFTEKKYEKKCCVYFPLI
jgi:hypothetical protein